MKHPTAIHGILGVSLLAIAGMGLAADDKTPTEQAQDTSITAQVKAALVADPIAKARNVDVEVFKGRVQLNGFVDTAEQRAQAATVASRVIGVTKVENNLEIKGATRTAGVVIDDAALTAKVKAALSADERTKAHQINVETRNGVVLLAGFVETDTERNLANQLAGAISGVKRVDNRIAVK